MEQWQKHEKHDREVNKILRDHGCMDTKKRIRRWTSGVAAALDKAGHSSCGFDNCSCWN